MRLSFGVICLLFSVPIPASAQSSPAEPASTIQANTNLVVVDVVATDSQNNLIHGLTKTDFTVLENGQPQSIKNFEVHTAAESTAPLPALPKLPPGVFTNLTHAPARGALNVLLLDTLNTPMADQAAVREQILGYLKETHPGTRIAVFGLTTRLILLEGFTTDPEVLRALLNGKKGLPKDSAVFTNPLSGDNVGAEDPIMDTESEMIDGVLGNDPSGQEILANLQQFEETVQASQLQLRARTTLDAFNLLARYLSGLPGRKNLIWFSGSFPINILPDPDLEDAPNVPGVVASRGQSGGPNNLLFGDPCSMVGSAADEFRETTELLSRSQVAVYPIDARGIIPPPMLDATNSSQTYVKNPGPFARDNVKFFQQTSDEHGTMRLMAEATGGEAFVSTNDLQAAVKKAIAAGSNYYTLAYTPADQQWNGNFRKIQVKVSRLGVMLAYRRGYYADDPSAPQHKGEPPALRSPQPAAYSALRAAMVRGGPDPTEITFVTSVRPSIAAEEPAVAPGNRVAEKVQGPFLRIGVHDLTSNRVGAVELPVTTVSKLPPIAAPAQK